MIHTIPPEWIAIRLERLQTCSIGIRCDLPHQLMAISDIERPMRAEGVTLDANGFNRERMMKILNGILADDALPPIDVEITDPGQRPYRLRSGFHRFYASFTCGFTHVPVDVVPRLW